MYVWFVLFPPLSKNMSVEAFSILLHKNANFIALVAFYYISPTLFESRLNQLKRAESWPWLRQSRRCRSYSHGVYFYWQP
jgi:hypothetical protein